MLNPYFAEELARARRQDTERHVRQSQLLADVRASKRTRHHASRLSKTTMTMLCLLRGVGGMVVQRPRRPCRDQAFLASIRLGTTDRT